MLIRQHMIYLTFMNYTILSLQLLPQGFSVARKDLWISWLLSSTVGFAISWVIWRVEKKYPGQTFMDMLSKQVHVWIRSALLLVLSLYTLALCVTTTANFTAFVNIGFLQETPFWVISALFVASIVYALRQGIVSIANLAGLLAFVTTFAGIILSIAISGNRNIAHLLPIGEYGVRPILLGVLYCIPVWVELFFLPLLPRKNMGSKGWLTTYLSIVAVNTFTIVAHDISPVSTFGMEQTLNLNFPLMSSVKTITLGYIDRFDVVGIALMMFGCYIRVGLYLILTLTQIQSVFPFVKNTRSWLVISSAGSLVLMASILMFRNAPTFIVVSQQWFVYTALFMLGILVSVYFYLGIVGKRSRTVTR